MYSKFIIRHKERDLKLCFIQTIVQVSFSFNVTTIFITFYPMPYPNTNKIIVLRYNVIIIPI